ncbi:MAG: XRE family transcriptional regulator [Pseudoclavibacter sp.]|nr:XRE family transcriptional regulator [Pseudoclavibacter sp.]
MEEVLAQFGPRLRSARRARGWTLAELASRSGVSASTLSRLESGKRRATLELLLPITRRLGVRIDDLLPPEPPDPRVRRPLMRRDGMVIAPLTLEGAPIHSVKIRYPPVAEPPDPRVHDGFEWLYVLSGRLRLRLGERVLVLERGEAAEFDTRIPHAVCAEGEAPAEAISIFDESGARMHLHGAEGDADNHSQ